MQPNGRLPARVRHSSPGRLRLRLERDSRSPERMEHVRRRLSEMPGVAGVRVNPQSGTVLVLGDPGAKLQDLVREVLDIVEESGPDRAPEALAVALVGQVDGRLRDVTGGRLSLRLLVPSVFVALGVRQVMVQGLTLGTIPWYVLIYYGVDAFIKLYPEYAPSARR